MTNQGYDPAAVRFPSDPFEHFLVASEAAERGLTWNAYRLFVQGDPLLDRETWTALMPQGEQ